jgi:hypothetical protein
VGRAVRRCHLAGQWINGDGFSWNSGDYRGGRECGGRTGGGRWLTVSQGTPVTIEVVGNAAGGPVAGGGSRGTTVAAGGQWMGLEWWDTGEWGHWRRKRRTSGGDH